MLPLMLDLARLRLLLVGDGPAALQRLARLEEAGAVALEIYAEAPIPALAAAAGGRLRRRLPQTADFARAQLVFIADPPAAARAGLAAAARAAGAVTHVEDDRRLTDVHAPAVLRRGDLTIAIATGGASPALAVQLKRFLGGVIGPEWSERLDGLAALRRQWRAAGAAATTITHRTDEFVGRQGWLAAAAAQPAAPQWEAAPALRPVDGKEREPCL